MLSIITEAIDEDSNSLSWGRRSMWRAALDGLAYDPSLDNWKRIVGSVKGEMELECGQENETWENFLSLE
jgi:hypothetical protein